MERRKFIKGIGAGAVTTLMLPVLSGGTASQKILSELIGEPKKHLRVSGVYPHLTVYNQEPNANGYEGGGGECGIGAVVPWQGKLWLITYSPHQPKGSSDKLYSIDSGLNMEVSDKSVGGTPANRMVHKESGQLIIGPYFIDKNQEVRVVPPREMSGRWTATARHLENPTDWVYFYDMEGSLFEVNVHSLEHRLLFKKPTPGWHGKGGYTANGRLILANNGDISVYDLEPGDLQIGSAPQNKEQIGSLAEWDGDNWSLIRRRQFTEVTGPGGLLGSPDDQSPAWSIGWDRRSVILMLLDNGTWTEFRLPKATHTYDGFGGWYTEWPRIREVDNGRFLMDMHGMLYDFPKKFSDQNISGIQPVCNHLIMITDFCEWNGELVFSTDQTSMMANKLSGQSQSNLWFGSRADIQAWGPKNGYGGVWQEDRVEAGISSPPFLIKGFGKKVVHLAHEGESPVTFTLEVYQDGQWSNYKNIKVSAKGYNYHVFPNSFDGEWIRVKTDLDCVATAYFHYSERGHEPSAGKDLFGSLASVSDKDFEGGLIRPAGENRNLQYLNQSNKSRKNSSGLYTEVDEHLAFLKPETDKSKKVMEIAKIEKDFEADEASVIVTDKTGSYRLPMTDASYNEPYSFGWPRGKREVITERTMLNAHGSFYEIALESGLKTIRPICTHRKKIFDYCSWRGLLVISGTKRRWTNDGHYFGSRRLDSGLWFGFVDDLWKLGQPVGYGGPWKDTDVKANEYSLPYLMTGYDRKEMTVTADRETKISVEIDFDHRGWHLYKIFEINASQPTITHLFPEGYSAHWMRVKADKDCICSVQLVYS